MEFLRITLMRTAIDIHGIRKHSQNIKETIDANVLKM